MGAWAGPFSQPWPHRDRTDLGKPGKAVLTASLASAQPGLALRAQPGPSWQRNAGPRRCLPLASERLRAAWQTPAGRKPGSMDSERPRCRQGKLNFWSRSRPAIVLRQAAGTYTSLRVSAGLNAACTRSPRCRQGSRSSAFSVHLEVLCIIAAIWFPRAKSPRQ